MFIGYRGLLAYAGLCSLVLDAGPAMFQELKDDHPPPQLIHNTQCTTSIAENEKKKNPPPPSPLQICSEQCHFVYDILNYFWGEAD